MYLSLSTHALTFSSFGGESLDIETLLKDPSEWKDLPLAEFVAKNTRTIREPEIFACARKLRAEYKKVGAIGFCFGGWAVFRIGAKGNNFVDCISAGHPTWLTKEDIDGVDVPVQLLAPEFDEVYTPELKEHTFHKLQELGVPFDYQHFPGVVHAAMTRGDPSRKREREAMTRGKRAAVAWFREWLLAEKEEE